MILVLATPLLQGVASTAQATTEELLTELDKPSEYFVAFLLSFKPDGSESLLLCEKFSL
jgi:hypothetical protein